MLVALASLLTHKAAVSAVRVNSHQFSEMSSHGTLLFLAKGLTSIQLHPLISNIVRFAGSQKSLVLTRFFSKVCLPLIVWSTVVRVVVMVYPVMEPES